MKHEQMTFPWAIREEYPLAPEQHTLCIYYLFLSRYEAICYKMISETGELLHLTRYPTANHLDSEWYYRNERHLSIPEALFWSNLRSNLLCI
jgi:hypothetical protein